MKTLHIIVKGRVQGVGFRHFARVQAKQRGLVGMVKNLSNGNVEIYANGKEEAVREYLNTIRQGPVSADVSDVDSDWQESSNTYDDFKVVF
ncbi:acylphosphatase [candidate division KSB1 bacterium]|nr:acylphosphatase [candidate division KSB1 bacterium]